MITVKTKKEIQRMSKACEIAALALKTAGEHCKVGITTLELDNIINKLIVSTGAKPSFLGYGGFPASACISINDEVIHGIPSKRKLISGDIVGVDVGAYYDDFHGDNAYTFSIGEIDFEVDKLLDVTKKSLSEGIKMAVVGNRIGDISNAIQICVEKNGFTIVEEYVGHGIGKKLHEMPQIPNFGLSGKGPRLIEGMTIAIEPMVNIGSRIVKVDKDNWTVRTSDGKFSAHFENTIAITRDGPVILTKV